MATQYDFSFSGSLPVAAQEGMQRSDLHAEPDWKHVFDGCVLAAARRLPELTSDDVLAELEAVNQQRQKRGEKLFDTHDKSAIGPAMLRAAKVGIIKWTAALRRSERVEKRGNLHRVWQSTITEAK